MFNPVDYAVTNIQLDIDVRTILPDVDGEGKAMLTNKNVTFSGTYDITKVYDYGTSKNVAITYALEDGYGRSYTCNTSSANPKSAIVSVPSGQKMEIDFSINCGVNFAVLKPGDNLKLIVKINGGLNGPRGFTETNYENNETMATIFTRPIVTEFTCDNTCTLSNTWFVNFDFVYQFDRQVVQYETNTIANLGWVDHKVGTVSGSTTNPSYNRPIASGNTNRAPDDYMAYYSHRSDTAMLCTDYRASFSNCWRYENNVNHDIQYYKYSTAVTSTYTTHQTLKAASGTCTPQDATFGGERYGSSNAGKSGSSHTWSNSTTTSGNIAGCHGYTQSPQGPSCPTTSDWWGRTICLSSSQVYSANASSGSKPGNYIPRQNFLDYTVRDNAGVSPTTKTDRVILKSQTAHTNGDQGSAHSGWSQPRTVDVCTLRTYLNISFSCPSGYTYGTRYGAYSTSAKQKGLSSCPAAGFGTSSRTCTWGSSTTAPSEYKYWPAVAQNTCYREHYDWRCDSYSGVSPDVRYYPNSSSGQQCHYTTSSSSFWTSGTESCTYYKYVTETNASKCGKTCTTNEDGSQTCTPNTCTFLKAFTGRRGYKRCTGVWSGSTTGTCGETAGTAPTPVCKTSNTSQRYRDCQHSSDVTDGTNYCYERRNEVLNTSDYRCAQWQKQSYEEIKYYTTASPRTEFTTRTYHTPTRIWQYTCNTNTPTVAYPSNNKFEMRYTENVTVVTEIKTERSGNWLVLQPTNNQKEANPRGGEWFELRTTIRYNTTRPNKPSSMPYLRDHYNNYHNINSFGANHPQYDTIYPSTNYPHYGRINTGKTAIGDGKSVKPDSGRDIVNNSDYGYCDVKPAEPYGSLYSGWQFAPAGQNNKNETQGHAGATWTSNMEGEGTVFFGPDNKTVWQKDVFGDDYQVIVEVCPASEPDCTKDNSFISNRMEEVSGTCTSYYNGMCASYTRVFLPEANKDANGVNRRGFYIPTDIETQTANIQISTSRFDAVGQYEKELIGGPMTTYGSEKFFKEMVGAPIKPLCACPSYEIITKDGEHGWATSEWEVE
jgi:hypothetical protein